MGRLRVWLLVFTADPYSNKINYSEEIVYIVGDCGAKSTATEDKQFVPPPTCAMSEIDVGISMRLQVDNGGKKSGEKWEP